MPRSFWPATAEQVVTAVEAVFASGREASTEFVAEFSDLPEDQAESALNLSADIGLLSKDGDRYKVASPLCRFLSNPNEKQKAAVLRIVLESYHPFLFFRERLIATNNSTDAAQQTKAFLGLDSHREQIKDTLVSLGTYSHALVTEGGGRYKPEESPSVNTLVELANSCEDLAAAEGRIRKQIGQSAAAFVSREDVLVPLADALLKAVANDPRGAVVNGGNAIDSYLSSLATKMGVSLTGATGINAKLEKFLGSHKLPKKLIFFGKYLGHVRNAADHGVDSDINASWQIRETTGFEYVYVACSFIASTLSFSNGEPPAI